MTVEDVAYSLFGVWQLVRIDLSLPTLCWLINSAATSHQGIVMSVSRCCAGHFCRLVVCMPKYTSTICNTQYRVYVCRCLDHVPRSHSIHIHSYLYKSDHIPTCDISLDIYGACAVFTKSDNRIVC